MAHASLRVADTPNSLPEYSIRNMVMAMMGPATYQGHGWERNSIITIRFVCQKKAKSDNEGKGMIILSY
jgi:hypothetical protein